MTAQHAQKIEHEIDTGSDELIEEAATKDVIADTTDVEIAPSGEPSWFTRTYSGKTTEELAERYQQQHDALAVAHTPPKPTQEAYDAYKRRLEQRFRLAQGEVDPKHAERHPPRPVMVAPRRPVRAPFGVQQDEKPNGRGMIAAIAFTLLACGVGGGAGYGLANPGKLAKIWAEPSAVFAALMPVPEAEVPQSTLIKVPPVARIAVNDVSGPVNGPIALGISTFPVDADTPIAIRITGLPPEAYITKGTNVAEGEWLLKSAEISKAQLVVPRATSSTLGLEVAVLDEKTGIEAAPPRQMNVALDLKAVPLPGAVPPPETPIVNVIPASALPDQGFNKPVAASVTGIPVPLQSINAEAVKLLVKGQMLLRNGDLISARQFFLKAHALKLPEAALYVGKTYDPETYESLGVIGLDPDAQLASEWYGKAAAQGLKGADDALTRLSTR